MCALLNPVVTYSFESSLSLSPPWIEALQPHQMCCFLALLIKKFLIFHVFCSNFKALVNSILLEESKFSLIHNPFFEICNGTLFPLRLCNHFLFWGHLKNWSSFSSLVFIIYWFHQTRSVEFTSNTLSIYSFLVYFVLPKKLLFEDIYDENQYTRNTWPIHLTTHSKSQSCVLIMRE